MPFFPPFTSESLCFCLYPTDQDHERKILSKSSWQTKYSRSVGVRSRQMSHHILRKGHVITTTPGSQGHSLSSPQTSMKYAWAMEARFCLWIYFYLGVLRCSRDHMQYRELNKITACIIQVPSSLLYFQAPGVKILESNSPWVQILALLLIAYVDRLRLYLLS